MADNARSTSFLWEGSTLEVYLPEVLLSHQTAETWAEANSQLKNQSPQLIRVIAKKLKNTDSSGISFLYFLKTFQENKRNRFVSAFSKRPLSPPNATARLSRF